MEWPPPGYRPDHGTGYAITIDDFRQLIGYLAYRPEVAAFFRQWLDCQIDGSGAATTIRTRDGATVDIDALHARIQADPQAQYYLYQTAMSLWR